MGGRHSRQKPSDDVIEVYNDATARAARENNVEMDANPVPRPSGGDINQRSPVKENDTFAAEKMKDAGVDGDVPALLDAKAGRKLSDLLTDKGTTTLTGDDKTELLAKIDLVEKKRRKRDRSIQRVLTKLEEYLKSSRERAQRETEDLWRHIDQLESMYSKDHNHLKKLRDNLVDVARENEDVQAAVKVFKKENLTRTQKANRRRDILNRYYEEGPTLKKGGEELDKSISFEDDVEDMDDDLLEFLLKQRREILESSMRIDDLKGLEENVKEKMMALGTEDLREELDALKAQVEVVRDENESMMQNQSGFLKASDLEGSDDEAMSDEEYTGLKKEAEALIEFFDIKEKAHREKIDRDRRKREETLQNMIGQSRNDGNGEVHALKEQVEELATKLKGMDDVMRMLMDIEGSNKNVSRVKDMDTQELQGSTEDEDDGFVHEEDLPDDGMIDRAYSSEEEDDGYMEKDSGAAAEGDDELKELDNFDDEIGGELLPARVHKTWAQHLSETMRKSSEFSSDTSFASADTHISKLGV